MTLAARTAIAHTPPPSPAMTIRLSFGGGLVFLGAMLLLNSLLALLGSLLWGYIPYWPAFVVSSIAAVYARWWGIALAVFSPIAAGFFFGDASLLFVPVNIVQVLLVLAAFRLLRLEPSLKSWNDRIKYVLLGAASPSFIGGVLAWCLLKATHAPESEPLGSYAWNWAAENTLPSIVPGIWLFGVVGESYKPFAFESGRKPVSWMRRSLEFSVPWLLTLICVGAMIVIIVVQQSKSVSIGASVPDAWRRVQDFVSQLPALRLTALVLSLCILYSVGSAVQHSKQSWALTEAVRRHLPNKHISELLTSGIAAPTEQRIVTVMFTDIRGFTEESGEFAARDLVKWLNAYLTRMCRVCDRHGGSIDKFIGDGLMVVFGLQGGDDHAAKSILCALEMLDDLVSHNAAQDARFPPIRIGVGLCTGMVVAGEIGSPERIQYTVIGSTVNIAARLEGATKSVPEGACEILMSRETARQAGLLSHPKSDDLIVQWPVSLKGVADVDHAFALRASALAEVRATLSHVHEEKTDA